MIIIPNSQIREIKAKRAYFSKVAHLIIDRLSETLSCHTCCFFYELTNFLSHTGPKSLFLSSHLFHSHKTMQFSLICARIPQKLQQRIVQGLMEHPQEIVHSLWIFLYIHENVLAPTACQRSHYTLGKHS